MWTSDIKTSFQKHTTNGLIAISINLDSSKCGKSYNAKGRGNAVSQALSSFDALMFAQDHEPVEWQGAAVEIQDQVWCNCGSLPLDAFHLLRVPSLSRDGTAAGGRPA